MTPSLYNANYVFNPAYIVAGVRIVLYLLVGICNITNLPSSIM